MSTLSTLYDAMRRTYQRLIRRQVEATTQEAMETLSKVPAFATCSQDTLHVLAEMVHRRTYRRGECLYYEGDPGLGMYVVQEGRIRLTAEDQQPGTVYELRRAGPNDAFGILSLLGDFRRMETAQTITEARVLGFFRPDLSNLMKRNPQAGAEITMALARFLANQHIELIRLMAESDGRDAAMMAYAEASALKDLRNSS